MRMPRITHLPLTTTYDGLADDAIELAAACGLNLLPWEQYVLRQSLGVRDDGKWSALELALIVSRQNGKGSILEARELAGLFLLGEQTIIHSAHEASTSFEAFNRIENLIMGVPDLAAQVAQTPHSHGAEGIVLKNGQRLKFRTRTKGGGRGFSGDLVIFDEAMYLNALQIAALFPTIMARPNPQVWYTGSAGDKESTQLGALRARAIEGDHSQDDRLAFMEYSIDACTDFCDPQVRYMKCPDHDPIFHPESWAKANPSMGLTIHTLPTPESPSISFEMLTEENIRAESRTLPFEKFLPERLGIGDYPTKTANWSLISEQAWMARTSEVKSPQRPLTFAINTNTDRSYSCIVAIGSDGEDGVCAEITSDGEQIDYRPGTNWVVPRCIELNKRWKPKGFVIDMTSQAGEFRDKLEACKIKVISPTSREVAQAAGRMYSSIVPGRNNVPFLWHRDQEDLNNAVRGASKRKLAGLWALDRQNVGVDISPLICVSNGLWGHEKFALEKSTAVDMAWG